MRDQRYLLDNKVDFFFGQFLPCQTPLYDFVYVLIGSSKMPVPIGTENIPERIVQITHTYIAIIIHIIYFEGIVCLFIVKMTCYDLPVDLQSLESWLFYNL